MEKNTDRLKNMNKYSYNSDTRVEAKYRSFKELADTDAWKNDTNKYVFERYLPNYYEGFGEVILTSNIIDELVNEVEICTGTEIKLILKNSGVYLLEDKRGQHRGLIMEKPVYEEKQRVYFS